jgi:hypothetical protein
MRSEVVVLDTEEAATIRDHHEKWNRHYSPQSPAAQEALNSCIYGSLLKERCASAFQHEVNRGLKRRNRQWRRNRARRFQRAWKQFEADPTALDQVLEFSEGCKQLREGWFYLGVMLGEHGALCLAELRHAIHLLGAYDDMERLGADETAYTLAVYGLRCRPDPADALLAQLSTPKYRPRALRGLDLEAWLPAPEECRAWIGRLIDERIAGLQAKEEALRSGPEAADLKEYLGAGATLWEEKQARLALRYHKEATSLYFKSVHELMDTLEYDAALAAEDDDSEGCAEDDDGVDGAGPEPATASRDGSRTPSEGALGAGVRSPSERVSPNP